MEGVLKEENGKDGRGLKEEKVRMVGGREG